jgi:hypothetical protein
MNQLRSPSFAGHGPASGGPAAGSSEAASQLAANLSGFLHQVAAEAAGLGPDTIVRCRRCGAEGTVDGAACLESDWPKCCGETMRLAPLDKDMRGDPASPAGLRRAGADRGSPAKPSGEAGFARFDGAAVWAGLSEEARAAIGAAALELVAGGFALEVAWEQAQLGIGCRPALMRAAEASVTACEDVIKIAFVDAVPRATLVDADNNPRIPSLLGGICRACGCSQQDACRDPGSEIGNTRFRGGCGWAAPDLCTACAGASQ